MDWIVLFSIFFVTGIITGIKAVIFGLGGGLVIVPVMYWIMIWLHAPHAQVMHLAIGTSLTVMIFTSLNTAFAQIRAGKVIWPVSRRMLPFVVISALVGSYTSQYFHSNFLRYFFIAFLAYTIIHAWLKRKHFMAHYETKDITVPKRSVLTIVALILGLIASWLGNGGSVITVPFLRKKAKMPMQNATATSTTLIPVIAICGAIGYIVAGLHIHGLPKHTLGFAYEPAIIGLIPGIFLGVPLGRKIVDRIPDGIVSKCYVVLLIIILASMLI